MPFPGRHVTELCTHEGQPLDEWASTMEGPPPPPGYTYICSICGEAHPPHRRMEGVGAPKRRTCAAPRCLHGCQRRSTQPYLGHPTSSMRCEWMAARLACCDGRAAWKPLRA